MSGARAQQVRATPAPYLFADPLGRAKHFDSNPSDESRDTLRAPSS